MISSLYNRVMACNHQQWGYLLGMMVGFLIAIFSLPYLSEASLPWVGKLQAFPLIFIKIISIPFIAGLFANIFFYFFSAMDILTNEKMIIHVVRKK